MIKDIAKVFGQAFKQAFSKESNKWWLGSPGALSAVLGLGSNWLGFDNRIDSILLGIAIYTGWNLLRFSFFSFKVGYNFLVIKHRESVYGDIIKKIVSCTAFINVTKKLKDLNDEQFVSELTKICDTYKEIFDRKTRATCSVSMKSLKNINFADIQISSDAEIFCIARDSAAVKSRHTTLYQQYNHRIHNNTCYNHILSNLTYNKRKNLFYLNNNIPSKPTPDSEEGDIVPSDNYHNSSYYVFDVLPYKSELVVPITHLLPDRDGNYKLLGFVCVDSDKPNSFDNNYDVTIMQGLADNIFDLFALYIQQNNLKPAVS